MASRSSGAVSTDRKSTRLNSSHVESSYAVFCLKKKNKYPPVLLPSLVYPSQKPTGLLVGSRQISHWLLWIILLHPSFLLFLNDTATTEIYTLSLHDALPISSTPPEPHTAEGLAAIVVEGLDIVLSKRSEEHTSELQSRRDLVCRLLLEK